MRDRAPKAQAQVRGKVRVVVKGLAFSVWDEPPKAQAQVRE